MFRATGYLGEPWGLLPGQDNMKTITVSKSHSAAVSFWSFSGAFDGACSYMGVKLLAKLSLEDEHNIIWPHLCASLLF